MSTTTSDLTPIPIQPNPAQPTAAPIADQPVSIAYSDKASVARLLRAPGLAGRQKPIPGSVATLHARTRTEFVVPRPSELHPSLPVPDARANRGVPLPSGRTAPGRSVRTRRHRVRHWQRSFRVMSHRYRLPIVVAAMAGAVGILVALASASPS